MSLGVYDVAEDVPLRILVDGGAPPALCADDPLIFGSRLADQYATARVDHGFSDAELASLARSSLAASRRAAGRGAGGGTRTSRPGVGAPAGAGTDT